MFDEEVDRFPSTRWTQVFELGKADAQARWELVDELVRRYWRALKDHLVHRRRIPPDQADDFLQGFMADKVLERNLFCLADPKKGRFRSFVVAALDNYVRDKWKWEKHPVVLPEDVVGQASRPDDLVVAAWAREVVRHALERMRRECVHKHRPEIWDLFHRRVVAPLFERIDPDTYEEILAKGQFGSASQAHNALATAKRMFARNLRRVIGEYTRDGDMETEIAELMNALARGR